MKHLIHAAACLALTGGAAGLPAAAQEVYKCQQAGGQLAYQDHPCGAGARDAGTVNSGYAAPGPGDDSAARHYQNLIDMQQREHERLQAESRRNEAEDRQRRAQGEPLQADQRDYRKHICQAQLDNELMHHRYASFGCDADGNKVPMPAPATVVVPAYTHR
jgi:hypothetical protein